MCEDLGEDKCVCVCLGRKAAGRMLAAVCENGGSEEEKYIREICVGRDEGLLRGNSEYVEVRCVGGKVEELCV